MAAPAKLPFWVHALDVLTVVALVVGGFVVLHGGFVVHPAGFRISITSEWRLFGWAAAFALLRHVLRAHPAIHQSIVGGLMAAGRDEGRLPDDRDLLGSGEPSREPARAAGQGRPLAIAAGMLFVYVALTVVMTYPQARQMHSVSPDIGDPLLSTWKISWLAYQVVRDPVHLYDANIFHPERRTLAYSDATLVPSAMIAPLLWAGVHQLVAYNVLLLSGFALSGLGMFVLVRYLTGNGCAALFAGFVFAFLPYRFMHYAHLELQMAQWMPLCLWAFHKTIAAGRLRDGLLTGFYFALQALSSWYYGIFFATFLVPVAAAALIGAGGKAAWRAAKPLAAGALLAAVLVAPAAVPYFQARQSVGERPDTEIAFYSAEPLNYLAAHPSNVLLGQQTASLGGQERELFQGLAVPLIALVGLWPPMSAVRIGYTLGLLTAFEASLGFNGVLYSWLHAYVLPYRGLRVPARMAIVVGLALAIFAGYGAARMCSVFKRRGARALVCAVLLAVAFVEYRVSLRLRSIWPVPPPVYAAVPASLSTVVLNLPLIVPDVALEPAYMYFSTFHWHSMVNGYSGFSPASYQELLDLMRAFPDDRTLDELRRRDVGFIIVHGAFFTPARYDQLVALLDARQDLRLAGAYEWYQRESRVYRVVAAPGPAKVQLR